MAKRKSKTYRRKTSKIYLTILGILLVLIAGVGVNSAVHFASWYPTFDSLKGQWDQYFGQTADLSSVDAPNLFAGEEDELAVVLFRCRPRRCDPVAAGRRHHAHRHWG